MKKKKPTSQHVLHTRKAEGTLYRRILSMLKLLSGAKRRDWNRSVPIGDLLSDRWEKAAALGFGKGSSVYDSCLILGDVKVGENTWIGPFTVLDGAGGLEIGSYCSISSGVQIYTHDSVQWSISAGKIPVERKPTHVGSRCYLGPNVIVAAGVRIGEGCVIGANSVVLSDIPANSKAVGAPCRVIGAAPKTDFTSSIQ